MTTTWRDLAQCRPEQLVAYALDPEIFYPSEGTDSKFISVRRDAYAQAVAVCADCPVRLECLDDAIDTEEWFRHGVRGGLIPEERKAVARRRGQRKGGAA